MGQEAEVTSTPTRPVENVVITTKGLQDRDNLLLDGRTVKNKSKLILSDLRLTDTRIFPTDEMKWKMQRVGKRLQDKRVHKPMNDI